MQLFGNLPRCFCRTRPVRRTRNCLSHEKRGGLTFCDTGSRLSDKVVMTAFFLWHQTGCSTGCCSATVACICTPTICLLSLCGRPWSACRSTFCSAVLGPSKIYWWFGLVMSWDLNPLVLTEGKRETTPCNLHTPIQTTNWKGSRILSKNLLKGALYSVFRKC